MNWPAAHFIRETMENSLGLTPARIASEFTIPQIYVLAETASSADSRADPFALKPGERLVSEAELAAILERKKARGTRPPG